MKFSIIFTFILFTHSSETHRNRIKRSFNNYGNFGFPSLNPFSSYHFGSNGWPSTYPNQFPSPYPSPVIICPPGSGGTSFAVPTGTGIFGFIQTLLANRFGATTSQTVAVPVPSPYPVPVKVPVPIPVDRPVAVPVYKSSHDHNHHHHSSDYDHHHHSSDHDHYDHHDHHYSYHSDPEPHHSYHTDHDHHYADSTSYTNAYTTGSQSEWRASKPW